MTALAAVLLVGCGRTTGGTATSVAPPSATTTPATITPESTMQISSPAFAQGEVIPSRFTCEGDDTSPELRITGIPQEAKSLVLIVDDPDAPAGTWDHWVEYDIPVTGPDLIVQENAGAIGAPGLNSWNETGYGGPCPPPGAPHRYFFRIYALDGPLSISEEADSEAVRVAMEGRILAEAELMGTFGR